MKPDAQTHELKSLLIRFWPKLEPRIRNQILEFHSLLSAANERQNLTRLIRPEEFFFGHLVDVRELLASGFLVYPAMDLGSGCGVPGLIAALFEREHWVLTESEKRKAEFLLSTVHHLNLKNITVHGERGEQVLKRLLVGSVVSRAVGAVDKIYSWIKECSTWNNLILLKGPGWDLEWENFEKGKYRNQLNLEKMVSYKAVSTQGEKTRLIVKLIRRSV